MIFDIYSKTELMYMLFFLLTATEFLSGIIICNCTETKKFCTTTTIVYSKTSLGKLCVYLAFLAVIKFNRRERGVNAKNTQRLGCSSKSSSGKTLESLAKKVLALKDKCS
jgi:hypothetical protein